MVDHLDMTDVKWDHRNPKKHEIHAMSLDRILEQLISQVTTLINSKSSSRRKKGRSKRAQILVTAIEKATEGFIKEGKQIAFENLYIELEMLSVVEDVRKTGEAMSFAAREFAEDPCSSFKHADMTHAARNLLSAVVRLLILADIIDVNLFLKTLKKVEDNLQKVTDTSNQQNLLKCLNLFDRSTADLITQAAKRQQELQDPRLRDDFAAARVVLEKYSTMLTSAAKVYVCHPELTAAKENRDCILRKIFEAITIISDVVQGKCSSQKKACYASGVLDVATLNDFETIIRDPLTFNEVGIFHFLDDHLMNIISCVTIMAGSSHTQNKSHEKIISQCKAIRQVLRDWWAKSMANMSDDEVSEGLEGTIDIICKQTKDLRRQCREMVADHVSYSFLETNVPLFTLIEIAQTGNLEVEACAVIFREEANMLFEVSNLACSMSSNPDSIKMVRCAAAHIDDLCPLVINSARILANKHDSRVAQENMEVFRIAWESQIRVLTEAVDDIIVIDDFLAVSERHIHDDVNECVLSLQKGYVDTLNRTASAIKGRATRVCNVVTAEMVLPKFAQSVQVAVYALSSSPPKDVDENEFIDASALVYDGVKEIRCAVLINKTDKELIPKLEAIKYSGHNTMEKKSRCKSIHIEDRGVDDYPHINGIMTAREAMRNMTEEDKRKIVQQVEYFRSEKLKFDEELAKWDDAGNEIIVLAKRMGVIMTEMIDFTRGRGTLKTTMDVINAAKKISEAGINLDKLTRQIGDQCPESVTKKDLLAYLQRIALYCHQLNITAKVKADVKTIKDELIVSELDSATSLIQAAKNLMNAVVLVVKASYVASTIYPRLTQVTSPVVVWKMKT